MADKHWLQGRMAGWIVEKTADLDGWVKAKWINDRYKVDYKKGCMEERIDGQG